MCDFYILTLFPLAFYSLDPHFAYFIVKNWSVEVLRGELWYTIISFSSDSLSSVLWKHSSLKQWAYDLLSPHLCIVCRKSLHCLK